MINLIVALLTFIGTICAYIIARIINQRYPSPFTVPILVSSIILIFFLLTFNINFETFMTGAQWIDKLLGPAVVALAYPLYIYRKVLHRYILPIGIGVIIGAIVGISSGVLLAKWIGIDNFLILSMASKSVTTPVAMELSEALGGVPTLTAVFVILAGIIGTVCSPYIFKWFSFNHYVVKGIAIGSASHAIGTSKAMENSQQEGVVSTVSMVLSALFVSVIVQGLTRLLML
ncbi:LrgB family protein [Ornithinibacillus halophilus]|uniref:TIGR00659 family protein n=1 Tax=Ornithinibacillus halophilus TaxID=930117 RepID=A0A1M5HLH1_9BACI|nr:LrgB family protein [Ornithinibacillus halophilus]SHG16748.1 TIGR00659 family protein [Ornithinibacillus halophilus]